jgi:hypothetical protein
MPPRNESVNDFGKNKFVTKVMEDVAKLTNTITQPDKFAQIFCEAAKTQKNIDHVLKDIIVELLGRNSEAQQAIASVVEKVDRDYTRVLSGKLGFGIWAIILIIVETVLHSYFK